MWLFFFAMFFYNFHVTCFVTFIFCYCCICLLLVYKETQLNKMYPVQNFWSSKVPLSWHKRFLSFVYLLVQGLDHPSPFSFFLLLLFFLTSCFHLTYTTTLLLLQQFQFLSTFLSVFFSLKLFSVHFSFSFLFVCFLCRCLFSCNIRLTCWIHLHNWWWHNCGCHNLMASHIFCY